MALKPCIASTANLNKDDVNFVLDAYQAYRNSGLSEKEAVDSAINDIISSVEVERKEWLDLINEQHPPKAAEKKEKEVLAEKSDVSNITEIKAFKRDDGLFDFMVFTGRVYTEASRYKDATGLTESQVKSRFGQEFLDRIYNQPVKRWFDYDYDNGEVTSKDEPAAIKPKKPTSNPAHKLAASIAKKITAGEKITWRELFAIADDIYGGTQADGAYSVKDAYDAMEMAENLAVMDMTFKHDTYGGNLMKAREALGRLNEMMQSLPTQTKRTEEQDQLQQYSTPHTHSFMAAWVANLKTTDVVLEPSAGTGNLAVHAMKAGVKNKNIYVNELGEGRANILRGLFDNVTQENATYLNSVLPQDIKPTVVIMNPPFSADSNKVGKKDMLLGAKHVEQALMRLQDGGRLVAILGKGMAPGKSRTRDWWKKIEEKYNVRANIQVSGEEYRKFGTTFDNQFIVIDNTGKTVSDIIKGRVESVAELLLSLGEVQNDRTYTAKSDAVKPGSETTTGKMESESGRSGDLFASTGDGSTGAQSKRPTGTGRGGRDADGRTTPTGKPGSINAIPDGKPGRGAGAVSSAGKKPGTETLSANNPPVDQRADESGVSIENADVTPVEIGDSSFEQYRSSINVAGSKPHPTRLSESAAMSAVKSPDATYKPHIDKKIITSGKLSDVQIESIIRAGEAHSTILPSGDRKGYFIGDGTGVGKGAQVAGIIQDNIAQGRKKAVWVSENQKLFEDAKRDIKWVGGDTGKLLKQSASKGDIKAKDGTIFTTYDTLRSQSKETKDASGNVITQAKDRLDQLIDWLGDDFDGVIAFDEAHNMANALDQKGTRGMKKASLKALAGVDLQKRLPNARVIYVSATGATEVENLGYADRLGLWGEGTPFPNKGSFITQIKSGGVAAMEVVAKDLKAMGVYTSRSLSYDDVEYSTIEHVLSNEQREIYDELAGSWQVVLANVNEALADNGAVTESQTNGRAKSAALSAFWGSHQRFFNQILTGMQTPSVITDIDTQLKDNKSAVLQLVNTNEAVQERRMNQAADAGLDLDEVDITPRDILMQYVANGFPTNQYEEYTDDDGNVRSKPMMDSKGNNVHNPESIKKREALLDKIGELRVPEGPLEQIINYFGSDAVAEITGRKRRLVRSPDGSVKQEKLGAAKSNQDAADFMEGKKRILIFSDAGGTGRSYHASNTVKNKQKRIHYLIQPGWRADKAVQGTGRTHRTNQAVAPHYKLVTTDIKAQRRFISTIARRLDQLGALTKGQRDTTSQGMFSADMNLEGEYGEAALDILLREVNSGKVEDMTMADFEQQTGMDIIDPETGAISETKRPTVPKFLNRLLSMKIEPMDKMFDAFYQRLESVIEYAKEQGTYDSGMETVHADEIRKVDESYTQDKAVRYVKVELDNPAIHIGFRSLPSKATFARNKRSGKLYAFTKAQTITDPKTGSLVSRLRRMSPSGGDYITPLQHNTKYTEAKEQAFDLETEWNNDLEKLSNVRTTTKHLITGTMLPIWDKLPSSQPRIIRMMTDKGEVLLGREIKNKDVSDTLKKIGISVDIPKRSSSEWMDQVLNNGVTLELANGWKVISRTVSGETRIEITGFKPDEADQVVSQGGFKERISFRTRLFLPTNETAPFERVLKDKPVIDVFEKSGQENPNPSAYSRTKTKTKGMPPQAVADTMDEFLTGFDNRIGIKFEVYPDKSAAFGAEQARKYGTDTIKGAYYAKSRKIVLIASDLNDKVDVIDTMRHELFAHHGLNLFTSEGKKAILEAVSASRKVVSLKGVWKQINRDYADESELSRAEEVIALIAQDKQGRFTKAWDRIVNAIMNALRAIGLFKGKMTKSDIHSLVNTMEEGLRTGKRQQTFPDSDQAQFAAAFHGTPHKFDKFSMDNIGTGEGAQAYGHGLYFAENPGVAKSYQAMLGNTYTDLMPDKFYAKDIKKLKLNDDAEEYLIDYFNQIDEPFDNAWDDFINIEDVIKSGEQKGVLEKGTHSSLIGSMQNAGLLNKGNLYEVDIPDEHVKNFLDWDAPLSEQNKAVKEAFGYGMDGYTHKSKMTGGELYREMASGTGGGDQATDLLNKLGIKGIKYYDQGSRTEGEGTRNLVVFDESIIEIKSVNGEPVTGDQPMLSRKKAEDKSPITPGRKYTQKQLDAIEKGGFGAHIEVQRNPIKAALGKAKDRIDESKQVWKTILRQGFLDQYDSFRTIINDKRAWMMANLSEASGGTVEAALEYGRPFMNQGAVDVDVSKNSLSKIFEPLGAEVNDWLMWVAGNRAERLASEDRERLFADVDIQALKSLNSGKMDDGRSRAQVYESVRKEFEEMNDAFVKIGTKTGVISPDEAAIWRTQGFYVPFYRVAEEEKKVTGPYTGGGLVKQTAYKRLKGADIPLGDLLTNVIMNWNHIVSSGLKNQAAVEALSSAEDMGLATQVPESKKSSEAVFIRLGGKKTWMELDQSKEGQLVLESLMSLNHEGMNNFMMKAARKFKRLLTYGVTANPEFKIANLVRDSVQAVAVAGMSTNIAKNILQGFKSTKKGNPTIARMIAGGGAFGDSGYIHGSDPEALQRLIKKDIDRMTILDSPKRIQKMWDAYQDFGARLENVNRAANFEQDLSRGDVDLLTANFNARDHLDFQRTGAFTAIRIIAQVVPFFNARLQGLSKLGRSGFDKNQRKQFKAVLGVYSFASVLLYLYMKDDDDYDEAPQWERDTYHLFKIPGSDVMYRFPRSFEVGFVATIAERAAEQVVNDKAHGDLFFERLWHGLTETLSFNPMPQMVMPAVEVWANKNTFTNRQIESEAMKNLSPSERKRAWTSETAIGMSKGFSTILWDDVVLSPLQIEHLVNGYFGWIGGTVLESSDMIIRGINLSPSIPERRIQDYTVVGRFARTGPTRGTRYLTEFYENLHDANRAYADIRFAHDLGDKEKAMRLAEKNMDKLAIREIGNSAQKAISMINKRIMVIRVQNIPSDEKLEEIESLNIKKNMIAKKIIDKMNDQ